MHRLAGYVDELLVDEHARLEFVRQPDVLIIGGPRAPEVELGDIDRGTRAGWAGSPLTNKRRRTNSLGLRLYPALVQRAPSLILGVSQDGVLLGRRPD